MCPLSTVGGVEAFGIEGFVIGRYGARLIIVVDEGDTVADVDGQGRRIVLEIFDLDRSYGRKQSWNGGAGAGGQGDGQYDDLQGSEDLVHVGAYVATGMCG
jgi:hypothetical protein